MTHEFRFVFGEPPDDVKEQIKRAMDHNEMVVVTAQHDLYRFLEELTQEQLEILRQLLHHTCGKKSSGAYYVGVITAMLTGKFGLCPCGHNHDEDLEKLVGLTDEEARKRAEEYGVTFVADMGIEGDDHSVVCNNCKMSYISLEDRMLRAPGPEGCHGCVEKSKWG